MLAFNDSLGFPIVNSSIVGHHYINGKPTKCENTNSISYFCNQIPMLYKKLSTIYCFNTRRLINQNVLTLYLQFTYTRILNYYTVEM